MTKNVILKESESKEESSDTLRYEPISGRPQTSTRVLNLGRPVDIQKWFWTEQRFTFELLSDVAYLLRGAHSKWNY